METVSDYESDAVKMPPKNSRKGRLKREARLSYSLPIHHRPVHDVKTLLVLGMTLKGPSAPGMTLKGPRAGGETLGLTQSLAR
eukprot:3318988-Amphidinium_carterae.1